MQLSHDNNPINTHVPRKSINFVPLGPSKSKIPRIPRVSYSGLRPPYQQGAWRHRRQSITNQKATIQQTTKRTRIQICTQWTPTPVPETTVTKTETPTRNRAPALAPQTEATVTTVAIDTIVTIAIAIIAALAMTGSVTTTVANVAITVQRQQQHQSHRANRYSSPSTPANSQDMTSPHTSPCSQCTLISRRGSG